MNTFTVTASGFPLPSLVQGGATLPAGVTFVDNGDGTGTLSGTPAAGTGGDYALTFTATQRQRVGGAEFHADGGRIARVHERRHHHVHGRARPAPSR